MEWVGNSSHFLFGSGRIGTCNLHPYPEKQRELYLGGNMFKRPLFGILLLILGGCGAAYITPKVIADDDRIQVLSLTAESVLVANRSSYEPKQLPAGFFQNAGGAAGARSISAAPLPSLNEQLRPPQAITRAPPAATPGPYQLGVGDVVLIATKSAGSTIEELSGLLAAQNRRQGYTVQDDGAIAIPDVGRIQLGGLTLEEAEAEVFQKLVENQVDPSFSLEIAAFNSKRVTIGGAVGKPIIAPITLVPLYLDEALSQAGGVDSSDPDFVTIRLYRDGALYQFPLNEFRRQQKLQKTRLIAGDSIYVDTEFELGKAQAYFAEQITLADFRRQGRTQALDELNTEITLRRAALTETRDNYQSRIDLDAVDRDYVYLTGEVTKPGRFAMPFGRKATLADALYSDGGFSAETGNPAQIYVLRGSPDPADIGAVTAWHLDASNAVNLIVATRMEMRPNDVIFIAEQPITRWNRAVQQFVPTLISTGAAAVSN